jgi:hypothetical protein
LDLCDATAHWFDGLAASYGPVQFLRDLREVASALPKASVALTSLAVDSSPTFAGSCSGPLARMAMASMDFQTPPQILLDEADVDEFVDEHCDENPSPLQRSVAASLIGLNIPLVMDFAGPAAVLVADSSFPALR